MTERSTFDPSDDKYSVSSSGRGGFFDSYEGFDFDEDCTERVQSESNGKEDILMKKGKLKPIINYRSFEDEEEDDDEKRRLLTTTTTSLDISTPPIPINRFSSNGNLSPPPLEKFTTGYLTHSSNQPISSSYSSFSPPRHNLISTSLPTRLIERSNESQLDDEVDKNESNEDSEEKITDAKSKSSGRRE